MQKKFAALYVEISGICNAKCPYCPKGSGEQPQGTFMEVGVFHKLLSHLDQNNSFPLSREICLYNWGEPFLHPRLEEILAVVDSFGLKANLSSNFLYLPKLSRKSLQTINSVIFSLSGFTQKSYGRIHGGTLSDTLNNLDMFLRSLDEYKLNLHPVVNWHRYEFNEVEMVAAKKYFEQRRVSFIPSIANVGGVSRAVELIENSNYQHYFGRDIDSEIFTDYLRSRFSECAAANSGCSQWNVLVINEHCEVLLCCGWSEIFNGVKLGSAFDFPLEEMSELKKQSNLCQECLSRGIAQYSDQYGSDEEKKAFCDYLARRTSVPENPKRPLVSIAMTVFNAGPFLTKSLESVLAQTYENFELIISDNASEDGSSEICQEFAKRDSRIKYSRNCSNIGPVRNGFKVIDSCSGDFIMPAADHDVYHPDFISRLLDMLQQDESVVLAYPRTLYIDENDHPLELLPDVIDSRGMDAYDRFCKVIWEFSWGNMAYGLFRRGAFREAWYPYPIIGCDHVFIAKLSLFGSIAQIDETLFFRRRNRPVENTQECSNRQVAWFVGSNYESHIPWTRMAYEHLKAITESELKDKEKELLYEQVRKCFPTRFGDLMRKEVMQLITEGPKNLSKVQSFPNSFDASKSELARIAHICRFFYPDIAELDTLISRP